MRLAFGLLIAVNTSAYASPPETACTTPNEQCYCAEGDAPQTCFVRFKGSASIIPDDVWENINGVSWKPGCPVGREGLRLLSMSHWDANLQPATGEMVVAAQHAEVVLAAFEDLYNARFPIAQMKRVDAFEANDNQSMVANNTSAFNCRRISGTQRWSQHAYGGAIDINPFWNPWVQNERVDPKQAKAFADRKNLRPGMLTEDSAAVTAFTSRGWGWGGHWQRSKDYQHVSATGE